MTTFFSTHLEVAVSVCSLVGVCISALLLLVLARNRSSPIIKAHSFAFTTFSLIGSLLTYLAPYTWPLDSPSQLCGVRPWAFTIPLYVLLCPLLAKQYRIHRIFNMQSLQAQRWGVSDSHVLLLSLGLILPQVVINVVWTTLHPLQPYPITLPTGAVIHDCHATSASAAFAWASVSYIAVLLLSAVYLTVRLRHLADEFNQSKDILSCTLLIFGAAVVIIALQVTERTDYNYRYAIRSFGLFLILLTWQLVIMLPKLWAIRRATSVAYSADERHRGPQRLPLTPHVIKQIAASIPPHAANKQKAAAAAAAAGGGGGDKDTMNVMFSAAAARQPKPNNYPALSTLMTFMSPAAHSGADGAPGGEQIELVVDPAHKPHAAASLHPTALDVNMLNRISVSSVDPQLSPSGTPSPSPFQSELQAGNHSGSELPQPSSSTSPKASPKTHLRSKSHSPFVGSSAGTTRTARFGGGGDGSSKPLSPTSGGLSPDGGRLPSLKQLRAGLTAGSGGVDSVSYAQSVGTGKGTVRGGRGGGGGKEAGGGGAGSSQFKTNFEDHLSPLYTPAAITVEQVPIFMQE